MTLEQIGFIGEVPAALVATFSATRIRVGVAVLFMLLLVPDISSADAIMRTEAMKASNIAEIFIDAEGVRVELEIGMEDLAAFDNLLPDPIYERISGTSSPLVDRLQTFFSSDLAIVVDGKPLPGYLLNIAPRDRVRRDSVSGEPLESEGESAETVVFAQLAYPFETPPEALTIVNGREATIGFVAYHDAVAVNDFRYLTTAQTLELDWLDPWYSAFERRGLRRTHFAPMSVFVYVEPYEVRKEIILRPKDLQRWVDLGLEDAQTIPVEVQPELKRQVGEFLRSRHLTTVDGEPVEGELARVNFLERTLTSSNVIDPPRELDLNVATLGVIFVYPTVAPLPENVQVAWDMFDERMQVVPAATVDQAGPLPVFLEPDFFVLEWENWLKSPELPTLREVQSPPERWAAALQKARWLLVALLLLSIAAAVWSLRRQQNVGRRVAMTAVAIASVCAVGLYLGEQSRDSDEETRELVADILHNVYRAFDFRSESDIYDVLSQSVAGELLTTVYLETRRGLVLENQGGARAKVKEVELGELSVRPADQGGFIAAAVWQVAGSVGHWGHLHERRNGYQAELEIRPVDGNWKLVSMQVLFEERL